MRASLVQQAVVGLSKLPSPQKEGFPTDEIVALADCDSPERRFLLQAGLEAIYRSAGEVASSNTFASAALPVAAEPESLPDCSPQFAALLREILTDSRQMEMAVEAFGLLTNAGQLVPPDLLPLVLNLREDRYRKAAAGAIGRRGRWLAQFHRAWKWAAVDADGAIEPAALEKSWLEGNEAERVQALTVWRTLDPDQARERLAQVLSQEKASTRVKLLACLQQGLSNADEPLLEEARTKERSATARIQAVELLSLIPDSRLCREMADRAKQMLTLQAGKLEADVPAVLPKEWEADGIFKDPPLKIGHKAWWLGQVLGRVPPRLWEQYFRASVEELIAAAIAGQWSDALLLGWATAVQRFKERSWAVPVYESCFQAARSLKNEQNFVYEWAGSNALNVVCSLPFHEREDLIRRLFDYGYDSLDNLQRLVQDETWSESLSRFYLERLRRCIRQAFHSPSFGDVCLGLLPIAWLKLAPSCAEEVAKPFDLPEPEMSHQHGLVAAVAKLQRTISFRKQLYEEIRRGT